MAFSVLFVCTANICRSAMAQQLFAAELGDGHPEVVVGSGGVRALVGHDVEVSSAHALRDLGVVPTHHEARQATDRLVESSDLVLTATSEHRAEVVRASPRMFRRTFTMREFVRLGRDLPRATDISADGLRARVKAVAEQRGVVEPAEPGQDEIGDPFGAAYGEMQRCAADIQATILDTARILGLTNASH